MDLAEFNTLVLTDGSYTINDKIIDWIKQGGKLIAIGRANGSLNNEAFQLKRKETPKQENGEGGYKSKLRKYGNQESNYITGSIPGAIYKVQLDNTHPLTNGMNDTYFSLKSGSTSYEISDKLWNVGYVDDQPLSVGFVGNQAKGKVKESVVIAHQSLGRGNVIYLVDNPLYRAFWEGGQFLMSNALFMVE